MPITGAHVLAAALKEQGVETVFGIVGVPVIETSFIMQGHGIAYYGFRNEQAASYAAGIYGYVKKHPGGCLVVSGPGMVHAIAGLANAQSNCWPMILIGGASDNALTGCGAFQESPQVEWARPYCKYAARPDSVSRIPFLVEAAVRASIYGRPGPVYLDFPGDMLRATIDDDKILRVPKLKPPPIFLADPSAVAQAASAIRGASKPLVIVGKGAAYDRAEKQVALLVENHDLPFLPTPMGKGVIDDGHPNNVAPARSTALQNADVVILVGARLNWILHFGAPPRFRKDVQVIQIDICPEEINNNVPGIGLVGTCSAVVHQLDMALQGYKSHVPAWWNELKKDAKANEDTVKEMQNSTKVPMNYFQVFNMARKHFPRDAYIVSEGANTMDIGRTMIPNALPRRRLDAGTYGTMGVGMGFAIAAAAADLDKKVIAVEGDSAFGFSGMEIETMVRYNLNICIIVVNNNGIFQGFEELPANGTANNTPPTALLPQCRYEKMAEALGAKGYFADTPEQVDRVVKEAMEYKGVSLINIMIEPRATRKPQKHSWLTLGDADNKSKL